jgi:hypothetical protein
MILLIDHVLQQPYTAGITHVQALVRVDRFLANEYVDKVGVGRLKKLIMFLLMTRIL